jgi:hypothetical protein
MIRGYIGLLLGRRFFEIPPFHVLSFSVFFGLRLNYAWSSNFINTSLLDALQLSIEKTTNNHNLFASTNK